MTVKYVISIGEDGPLFFDKDRKPTTPIEPVIGYGLELPKMDRVRGRANASGHEWSDVLKKYSAEARKSAVIFTI